MHTSSLALGFKRNSLHFNPDTDTACHLRFRLAQNPLSVTYIKNDSRNFNL